MPSNKNQINNWLNQDNMQKMLGSGIIELAWVKKHKQWDDCSDLKESPRLSNRFLEQKL